MVRSHGPYQGERETGMFEDVFETADVGPSHEYPNDGYVVAVGTGIMVYETNDRARARHAYTRATLYLATRPNGGEIPLIGAPIKPGERQTLIDGARATGADVYVIGPNDPQ